MRSLMPTASAMALGRILDQLDRELVEASDEDILEAARDLGMNPMMKGSAAFLGLQSFSFAEFLDVDALRNVLLHSAAQERASKESKSLPRSGNPAQGARQKAKRKYR